MNWLVVIFSMTASSCLTVALIYGFIWWRQRNEWAYLLFALASMGTAALAWQDLLLNSARSIAQYNAVVLWSHVSISIVAVSLMGFIRLYLHAGRTWLLWTVFALRAISLTLNFRTGENLYYREVPALSHLSFFSESVSAPAGGVPNPWLAIVYLSVLVFLVFVTDAAISVWRRGERAAALSVGSSVVVFVSAAAIQTAFIVWGHAQWPSTPSLFYLGIIFAMGYELGGDALRASVLTRELHASQQRVALEAQAHRSEVAHLLRVSNLGDLSSAMAHELSQPLAAILSNAQAAEILLARNEIDAGQISHILHDIVSDDKRAADVISRLRALLKRGEFQPVALKTNDLIRDVLVLVHYELMARHVRAVTDLTAELPAIRGDRVELQQVLINLILNAVDAMSETPENARFLTIQSRQLADNHVLISVADTGCGIPAGAEEKIFEPYHTTKSRGLGLGLSLSRSIVTAHGGRLWAENLVPRGAIFQFTVPEWHSDFQDAQLPFDTTYPSLAARTPSNERHLQRLMAKISERRMIAKSYPLTQ
jgi:signal transduction histidine kinase